MIYVAFLPSSFSSFAVSSFFILLGVGVIGAGGVAAAPALFFVVHLSPFLVLHLLFSLFLVLYISLFLVLYVSLFLSCTSLFLVLYLFLFLVLYLSLSLSRLLNLFVLLPLLTYLLLGADQADGVAMEI